MIKPVTVDGQRAVLNLLRQLEALNWNQNAPLKSRKAVKSAIQSAVQSDAKEFERFVAVLTDWLTSQLMGFTLDLDEYEADVSRKAARSNRQFRRFLAGLSGGAK